MRVTWAEIDLAALKHNLHLIRKRVYPAKTIAVVKANAYGHGIVQVSRAAVEAGVDYLGVGFLEEGKLLRRYDSRVPILVLGGVLFRQIKRFFDYNLDITVSSLGLAYAVNKTAARYGVKAKIHLKFDTGLNRIGIHYKKAPLVFERIIPLKNLEIKGIYSHFSTSDEPDGHYTRLQLNRFRYVIEQARNVGIEPTYTHIACSGALLNFPETFFNMVRVGLAMYGLFPSNSTPRNLDLRPVMSFKSRIVFLKTVNEGAPISYGRTFYAQQKTRIATIPVGYGDGYNRKLSNNGFVLIHGKRCPIVGTVCMDQIMVDVERVPDVKVGDEVVLYGRQGDDIITVEDIAARVGTIPYEVACWLARRVPRVYIGGVDTGGKTT